MKEVQRQADERARQERERNEEAEHQRHAEETRKRQEFLNRYLSDQSLVNSPDSTQIAVVVVSKDKDYDSALSGKLKAALTNAGAKGSDGLFSEAFLADGLFDRLWAGSSQDAASLELSRHVDWLILCRVESEYEDHPELGNSLTARVTLTVHVVRPDNGIISFAFGLSQAGVGFSKATALEAAYGRVAGALKDKSEIKSLLGGK